MRSLIVYLLLAALVITNVITYRWTKSSLDRPKTRELKVARQEVQNADRLFRETRRLYYRMNNAKAVEQSLARDRARRASAANTPDQNPHAFLADQSGPRIKRVTVMTR